MNICFIGNKEDSFVGNRIEGLSQYLNKQHKIHKFYDNSKRNTISIAVFFRITVFILKNRIDFVYLMSQNPSRVLSVWLISLLKKIKFLVDTGDLLYDMYAETGEISRVKIFLIKIWENISLKIPDAIVVRGYYHKIYLEKKGFKNVYYIPDGVYCEKLKKIDSTKLRNEMGLENKFTLGILATIGKHDKLKLPSPGWDLVDVLALLSDIPVHGIVIGDGPGLSLLKERAINKGVEEKITYVKRLEYKDIPKYLSLIDVCIHTALNNVHSMVRTTGKLPIYMSCSCCIIASDVGTVKNLFKSTGMLIHLGNSLDEYVHGLSEKIKNLYYLKDLEKYRLISRQIAEKEFDYKILGIKVEKIINGLFK